MRGAAFAGVHGVHADDRLGVVVVDSQQRPELAVARGGIGHEVAGLNVDSLGSPVADEVDLEASYLARRDGPAVDAQAAQHGILDQLADVLPAGTDQGRVHAEVFEVALLRDLEEALADQVRSSDLLVRWSPY